MTIPMMRERSDRSARAAPFGMYPSSRIASSTRARMSGVTLSGSFRTRETDAVEQLARRATSTKVTPRGAVACNRLLIAPVTTLLRPAII